MISNTLFITYTIMCFLSLQAITLIIIIGKHRDVGKTRLLKASAFFIVICIILGLFYYITYYRELVLGEFAANIFLRALDSVIFYAMGYSWVKLIDAIIVSPNPKMALWRKYTNKVFAILMICSAMIYIFLLDEYYSTDQFWAEVIVIVAEIVLGLTVIVFTAAYIWLGYRDLLDKASRHYILTVSILVNFNNLWNNTVVVSVFIHQVDIGVKCTLLYGVTSILLLIINFLTIFYMYKKDFSPLFFEKDHKSQPALTEEDLINLVAEQHRLTQRERDVFFLAYQGLTNPDIADRLFISKHTVKRHMHNIFEKLDVSTRVELMHLVQSQSDHPRI